jgi:hypothetical protein
MNVGCGYRRATPSKHQTRLLRETTMLAATKVEIFSICAAFAFITGVLVAVW